MVAVAAMEKIEVTKRKRDEERKRAYLNLVLDVLDGREPDPELAADILCFGKGREQAPPLA
jgi:hypothetical protein